MKKFFRFGLYFILIAPLLLFIVYAFSNRWFFPKTLPMEWSVVHFERAINDSRTVSGISQGIIIASSTSIFSLVLGFPAARVLGLRKFKGRQLAWILLFLPTIVPPLAIGMGLNILFLKLGLAGTLVGVVLAHIIPALPYTIFTLAGAFARYDENYEHQALALGANRVQIFFNITLRLMTPSLIVAALFAFLISWSQYLLTLLIGAGKIITLPILLFAAASGGNPSTIAIKSLLFVLPPVLIIAFTARQINQHGNEIREQY